VQSEYSLFWREPERSCCRCSRSSASASCRSARSGGVPDRQDRRDHHVRSDRLPQRVPRFSPRRARPTWRWSTSSSRRRAQAAHAGAGRARLAARARTGHRADSRTTKLHPLEENLGAAELSLTDRGFARDRSRGRRGHVGGRAPPPARWRCRALACPNRAGAPAQADRLR
jgi:hypothetical protein